MKPQMLSEFSKFMDSSEAIDHAQARDLRERTLQPIINELSPTPTRVIGKIATIHLVLGTITLLFCPQFGVGFLADHTGLMAFFMRFGPVACAALCGAFFMGTTTAAAAWVLSRSETQKLRRQSVWTLPLLSGVSLGLFLAGGGHVDQTWLPWIVGAVAGGAMSLETGFQLRLWARV